MSDEEECTRRWVPQVQFVERIEIEGEWLPADGREVPLAEGQVHVHVAPRLGDLGVGAREAAERVGEGMREMRRSAMESQAAMMQVSETWDEGTLPEAPNAWPVAGIDYHVEDERAFLRNPLRYNPLISLKTLAVSEVCTCADAHVMAWDRSAGKTMEERACWRCRDGFGDTCKACRVQLRRERRWMTANAGREAREGEHDE